MKTQIKNIINEAGQQIAFKCFKRVQGQIDLIKAEEIAEEYAEKIIVAAAPCKNKVEELEYQLKKQELFIHNQTLKLIEAESKADSKEKTIKNMSLLGKILWAINK